MSDPSAHPFIDFYQEGHPVFSGQDALGRWAQWMEMEGRWSSRIFILTDENTGACCAPALRRLLPENASVHTLAIKAGETSKDLAVATQVFSLLDEITFSRDDVFIALGGGVVTDLGGFVASIYKRGLRLVNMSTSLLGMVDAGIGGKNGIDWQGAKNMLGTIRFPEATVCDTAFLDTLPPAEWKNGLAECCKQALIGSPELWKQLQADNFSFNAVNTLLPSLQAIKRDIVEKDAGDRSLRKVLNFGHTVGHALESESMRSTEKGLLPHGTAVAMGMILETEISSRMKCMDAAVAESVMNRLAGVFGEVRLQDFDASSLLGWMRMDKKNRGSVVRMSLLADIGVCRWDVEVDESVVQHVLVDFGAKYEV